MLRTGKSLFEKSEYMINTANEKLGVFASFFLIIIMLTTLFEIISRYFFNKPTVWVWGVNTQIFALIVFLGGGYQLLHRKIIVADVLYDRFSNKWKRVVDIISFACFLVFYSTLLWKGTDMALRSIMQREYSQDFFKLPLFPIKTMLPLGTIFIIAQWSIIFFHDIIIGSKRGGGKDER